MDAKAKELYERLERERPGVIDNMRRMIKKGTCPNMAAVWVVSADDPPEINELIHKVARLMWYEPAVNPATA